MNFNKRIAWILSSLERASAKRTALIAKIPVLRKNVSVLEAELDAVESEMDSIDGEYARSNGRDHEWQLLVEVLENEACVIEDAFETAEEKLEDAECSLDGIEGSVEAASYDAVDAAKA